MSGSDFKDFLFRPNSGHLDARMSNVSYDDGVFPLSHSHVSEEPKYETSGFSRTKPSPACRC